MAEKLSWEFPRGHELAPGRTALRALGGGSRCQVYLVWDEPRRRLMVAKVLRRDLVEDDRALRALRRELEALEALTHAVLVRPAEGCLAGRYPHLLLEYVAGPTLRKLIKRDGPVPLERVLSLAVDVATLLAHMASEGWVHLDVKPGNVVMGRPPRVIDLSLARTVERAGRLTGHVGTNAYMAPEQCHPHGDVGPAADIWGLGATLHHALSGARPFREPRTREEDAQLEDRFPQLEDAPRRLPAGVPGAVAEVVFACLEKDPARRPAAGDLGAMLRPLARDAALGTALAAR